MTSYQLSKTNCIEYKHLEILYNWCVDVWNNLNTIPRHIRNIDLLVIPNITRIMIRN